MKVMLEILLFLIIISQFTHQISEKNVTGKYLPTWESLDSRPLPSWYDDIKVGIFMHFGVFSVPSFGHEWFWYYLTSGNKPYVDFMKNNYPENFHYQDFAPLWRADLFNATKIAQVAKDSGAKYVIFTTKHHEGFALWPSTAAWNWNSVDIGPKKNFIKMIVDALRKEGIKVFLYFSWYQWYHPYYLSDRQKGYKERSYVEAVALPQIYDLIKTFEPDGLWGDGDWEASSEYWKSKEFLAWLFNDSPVKDKVVVNDRFGAEAYCHHGSFKNCKDKYMPDYEPSYKWENIFSLDKLAWGNRREATISYIMTMPEIFKTIFQSLSFGGNVVLNTGISSEGTIPLIYQNIYKQVGQFLRLNGESVYETKPWRVYNETVSEPMTEIFSNTDTQEALKITTQTVWYTASKINSTIYASFINWPIDNHLILTAPKVTNMSKITMFGYENPLKYEVKKELDIKLPDLNLVPSMPAYALKLENFT